MIIKTVFPKITEERANKKIFSQSTVTVRAQLLRGKGNGKQHGTTRSWSNERDLLPRRRECRLTKSLEDEYRRR